MATRTLHVPITGDSKDFNRAVKSADSSLDRFGKSGSRTLGHLKTGLLALGAAAAAGAVVGLKKSAEAAIESEKANARLRAQLGALGISYDKHEKQIQRVIDRHSQLSGFDDEDLGDSFTNIVRVVGDVNKALDLNAVAMDIARARHMDVAKAGELVGKVAGGNTGILSRYGIVIEEGASATEALALLQGKFSGQAEAYGKTTAGAVDRSKVAFENLGETLGANVTPLITRVAEGFSDLVRQWTLGEGPGGRIRAVFEDIAGVAGSVVSGVRGIVSGFREGDTEARALVSAVGGLAGAFVAFKVGGVIVAGVDAVKTAFVGLGTMMKANPFGIALTAVGLLVGALATLGIKTDDNAATQRELTDAYRAQADAMRQVRDIDLDLAQRKANVKSATVAVEQAEKRLADLRKRGAGALDIKQAEADLRQARVNLRRSTRDLGDAEEDAKRKRQDATAATKDANAKTQSLIDSKRGDLRETGNQIRTTEDQIEVLKRQGFNTEALEDKVENLRKRQSALRREIARLESKKITVDVAIKIPGATPDSPRNRLGDGLGVRGAVSRAVQHGFDTGALLPVGSGSLMGADFDLGPFAAFAAGQGLGVVSGLRPGAVTSSGNQSYHATGDAIDVAGPPSAMMRFAQLMRSMFGPRLRELIYTPMGTGIKDGRPYTYGGQVAADHYDHVHLAYTGPFGDGLGRIGRYVRRKIGDGLGKFKSTAYGPPWDAMNGTGVTRTGVNLKGGPKRYGVAVDPSVIKLGTKLRITPNPFGYSGLFEAFDIGGAIKGREIDFYDWRGRKSQLAWGERTVSVSTPGGGGRGGSRGGTTSGGSGGGGGRGSVTGGSGNTVSGVGDTDRDMGAVSGPGGGGFEQRLADVGVAQARARRRDNLAGLIKAMQAEVKLKRRRLKRIAKLLRGRLKRDTRLRLTQEQATLIGEIGDLRESLKEYRADVAGGATTITRADELEAGVDTSVDTGGDAASAGGGETPTADPNIARLVELKEEERIRDIRIERMLETQGPQILAAFTAMFNSSIGGKLGLGGLQAAGVPGQLARY